MTQRKTYMNARDMAEYLGQLRAERDGLPPEQATPLSEGYIRQLVSYARGTRTSPGRNGQSQPIPLPDEGTHSLVWSHPGGVAAVKKIIRKWYMNGRVGQGVGGGPQPKSANKRTGGK